MTDKNIPIVKAGGKHRKLNARKDIPDIRDRMYEPALIQLRREINYQNLSNIRDQGEEGACTGFGLAAVVDNLNKRNNNVFIASTRMLYEMAKKHDEWPGEDYAGSSCRGAIRGWKNMGVCAENDWPYDQNNSSELTIDCAWVARNNTLGAYYRLRPEVNDYHAALNEVGALYVSASVHTGWWDPKKLKKNASLAVIQPNATSEGGHAFAIVGYNDDGFIVQNSWGSRWGTGGFALWLYEDWLANITDGWVFRLAVPTPKIFGLTAHSKVEVDAELGKRAPKRMEIAGHFVHFDDGKFKPRGNYWSTSGDVERTADLIKAADDKYQHLLIYAHGGLNSPKASASRIAALKDGFRRNGIYPFHIMYDTGLGEELKDAVLRAFKSKPTQGFFSDLKNNIVERSDEIIEDLIRKPVTPIWDEIKRDAFVPFETTVGLNFSDGVRVIKTFAEKLATSNLKIHLAGHSTGAILLGHLLDALDTLDYPDLIASCNLMAPACTIEFYKQHYEPRLIKKIVSDQVSLPKLNIYNLNEKLELDDSVAGVYRKSLLYLVSNAFERETGKPLLGMQRYSKRLKSRTGLNFYYSNGKTGTTTSTSHGDFDNDANTMNAILRRILGKTPSKPFLKNELKGY